MEKDVKSIKPPTNDEIITMISVSGTSVFSMINDTTKQQQCTDENIKTGIQNNLNGSKHIALNLKKKMTFIIQHSQCTVEYNF